MSGVTTTLGVDAVTTSQKEADEKRGREIRKQEEERGKQLRLADERCRKGRPLPTDTCAPESPVSRFVERILENLYVNFSGATLEGLEALPDQEAASRVRQQLDEIARRRVLEEGE